MGLPLWEALGFGSKTSDISSLPRLVNFCKILKNLKFFRTFIFNFKSKNGVPGVIFKKNQHKKFMVFKNEHFKSSF